MQTLRMPGSWTPRRPRLVGAIVGPGGALVITGSGVLIAVLHDAPDVTLVGPVVLCIAVLMGLVLLLGVHSPGRLVALILAEVFLLVMVPYGFRSAVLDWRGEHVRATVTTVRHETNARTGGVSYTCKVLDVHGRSSWLQDSGHCDAGTRPGDRYEILRDPADLVSASTSRPTISFPVLLAYTSAALLLMALIGAQMMTR